MNRKIKKKSVVKYPTRSYTKKDLNRFLVLDKEESKKLQKKGLL